MARSVIVTGGFGILGQAVAEAFSAQGDKVARIDFAPEAASPLAGALDIGGVNLTDAAATEAALAKVVAAHGGIDVLVNVAGGFTWETLGDGKIALLELLNDPGKYANQTVTTQGYYFWNGPLAVLAEGISTEEDGGSPQPIGKMIWMEGFPADKSGELHLGPNNSYVWGKVEVTGQFQSGGAFGKDGAYKEFLQVTSAQALENVKK